MVHTEVENSASSEGKEVYKPNAPSKDDEQQITGQVLLPGAEGSSATMRKPEGVDPLQEDRPVLTVELQT